MAQSNLTQSKLEWQSKVVLLVVVPCTAIGVVLQAREWALNGPSATVWILGLSLALGMAAWGTHSATPFAAATGAVINASLMFSTLVFPYYPWRTALVPVLTVLVLTSLATRFGRSRKERLGTAEGRRGRGAAQVAANLGFAALLFEPWIQSRMIDAHWFSRADIGHLSLFAVGLAALAEAAADTLSSELGQVLGGQPRMITSMRKAEAGTDGAISFAGTLAGVLAAGLVSGAGVWAFQGGLTMLLTSWAGGVFGLVFDSLLGATLERRGWLNNDAVNFLSTGSAAGFALGMLAVLPHAGVQ